MVKTEKKKPLDFGPEAGLTPSREGADNFQRIINDTMVDGLVVIDEKGIVLSINKACTDIFGYSEKEVVGNNVNMLMNRRDKKHHDGYLSKYLKTGKAKIIGLGPKEVTGRRKDGSAVALELVINSHKEEGGETIFVGSLRDITQRKQAEAAVKEAEDQYKMLADHATDIVILEDTNSRVIYASPSLERHLGIDPEDAVGKNSWDMVHPEDRKKTRSDWKKVVLGEKKPCISRLRFQHAEGQYIWFESLCTPVVDEAGKVTAVISRTRNISEQYEAEEKLNLVTENMSDIIFLFDTAGKILFVSPSIKNQLGWTIDEQLGKTCLDILHPEDKPLWSEWKRGVMEKGNPFTSRVRYRHKDGSYCWFESVTQPIKDKKGRVTAAVMASRNITEQHEAEEKLKMLAENTSDIITLRDSSGKVIYITPSFEKHLGYDPEKERGKNPRLEIIHPDDRGKLELWEKRVYREGKPFLTDLRLKSAKGVYLWFESHTEPIKNKKGEVIAAVTTSRNITEQHEAEEKLKMLADNASDIIMLHGEKGEITYITPALKKHLGINPGEVIGKQTIGTVHPEDKKDLAKNWNQRVLKEGKSFYKDVRFRNKKGEYLWFECHTQPIKDEKGRVIAAVTTSRNISEYKQAESEALRLGRIVEESLNEIYT
ncbi:MAG: PAS domain-containing protein, partial [Proteobacteria bacterium]|nr:PAS domain-containing protein [Pseudomonadota bacterium]